jgi:hypothetical protein
MEALALEMLYNEQLQEETGQEAHWEARRLLSAFRAGRVMLQHTFSPSRFSTPNRYLTAQQENPELYIHSAPNCEKEICYCISYGSITVR